MHSVTFFNAGNSRLLGMGRDRSVISWSVLRCPMVSGIIRNRILACGKFEIQLDGQKNLRRDRNIRFLVPDGFRHRDLTSRGNYFGEYKAELA